jgi:hypothetical protein
VRRIGELTEQLTAPAERVLSVPVYVHGERWGAAVIGWDPDAVRP